MSQRSRVPRYLLHKASGQARVRVRGQDLYLGLYDSPESHERYARIVAELAQDHTSTPDESAGGVLVADRQLHVNELVLQYLRYARDYYGAESKEVAKMRDALRVVCELYGHELARRFGPLALKTVRSRLISDQICRNEINRRLSRIKRAFRWPSLSN